MEIISGQNVDLITPFPAGEEHRIFGWNHCYRSLSDSDDVPAEKEAFTEHMARVVQVCPSFGVVDKHQLTNRNHEAPLVGIGIFEPATARHGYLHFACARKAFKMGLIDEAGELAIAALFNRMPNLLRIGAYTNDRNSPAKALSRRLGFKFEGLCEDMEVKDGKTQNIAYFGLTRRNWLCQIGSKYSCSDSSPEPAQPEVTSQELSVVPDKDSLVLDKTTPSTIPTSNNSPEDSLRVEG